MAELIQDSESPIWLVLRLTTPVEILGIFASQSAAVSQCTEPHDLVGPLHIDEILPIDKTEWPGAFYPVAKAEGE